MKTLKLMWERDELPCCCNVPRGWGDSCSVHRPLGILSWRTGSIILRMYFPIIFWGGNLSCHLCYVSTPTLRGLPWGPYDTAEPNWTFATDFSDCCIDPCSSLSATPCLRCMDKFNCYIAVCLMPTWPRPCYTAHRGWTICWVSQGRAEPWCLQLQATCQTQGWIVSEGC